MADPFAALALVTAFLVVGASRLLTCLRALSVQALALAGVAVAVSIESGRPGVYAGAVAVLLIARAALLRFGFKRLMAVLRIRRDVESRIGLSVSLVLTTLLVGLAFSATGPLSVVGLPRSEGYVAVAVSLTLLGLLVMVTRRKAVTQVMGLVMMEHGVFLMAMSTAAGLPLIVELGIFLDVLVGVFLVGLEWCRVDDALEDAMSGETP